MPPCPGSCGRSVMTYTARALAGPFGILPFATSILSDGAAVRSRTPWSRGRSDRPISAIELSHRERHRARSAVSNSGTLGVDARPPRIRSGVLFGWDAWLPHLSREFLNSRTTLGSRSVRPRQLVRKTGTLGADARGPRTRSGILCGVGAQQPPPPHELLFCKRPHVRLVAGDTESPPKTRGLGGFSSVGDPSGI